MEINIKPVIIDDTNIDDTKSNDNDIDWTPKEDKSQIQFTDDIVDKNSLALDIVDLNSSHLGQLLNEGAMEVTQEGRGSWLCSIAQIKARQKYAGRPKSNTVLRHTPLELVANEMMQGNKNQSTVPIQIKVEGEDWTVNVPEQLIAPPPSKDNFPLTEEELMKALRKESLSLLEIVARRTSIRADVHKVYDFNEKRLFPFRVSAVLHKKKKDSTSKSGDTEPNDSQKKGNNLPSTSKEPSSDEDTNEPEFPDNSPRKEKCIEFDGNDENMSLDNEHCSLDSMEFSQSSSLNETPAEKDIQKIAHESINVQLKEHSKSDVENYSNGIAGKNDSTYYSQENTIDLCDEIEGKELVSNQENMSISSDDFDMNSSVKLDSPILIKDEDEPSDFVTKSKQHENYTTGNKLLSENGRPALCAPEIVKSDLESSFDENTSQCSDNSIQQSFGENKDLNETIKKDSALFSVSRHNYYNGMNKSIDQDIILIKDEVDDVTNISDKNVINACNSSNTFELMHESPDSNTVSFNKNNSPNLQTLNEETCLVVKDEVINGIDDSFKDRGMKDFSIEYVNEAENKTYEGEHSSIITASSKDFETVSADKHISRRSQHFVTDQLFQESSDHVDHSKSGENLDLSSGEENQYANCTIESDSSVFIKSETNNFVNEADDVQYSDSDGNDSFEVFESDDASHILNTTSKSEKNSSNIATEGGHVFDYNKQHTMKDVCPDILISSESHVVNQNNDIQLDNVVIKNELEPVMNDCNSDHASEVDGTDIYNSDKVISGIIDDDTYFKTSSDTRDASVPSVPLSRDIFKDDMGRKTLDPLNNVVFIEPCHNYDFVHPDTSCNGELKESNTPIESGALCKIKQSCRRSEDDSSFIHSDQKQPTNEEFFKGFTDVVQETRFEKLIKIYRTIGLDEEEISTKICTILYGVEDNNSDHLKIGSQSLLSAPKMAVDEVVLKQGKSKDKELLSSGKDEGKISMNLVGDCLFVDVNESNDSIDLEDSNVQLSDPLGSCSVNSSPESSINLTSSSKSYSMDEELSQDKQQRLFSDVNYSSDIGKSDSVDFEMTETKNILLNRSENSILRNQKSCETSTHIDPARTSDCPIIKKNVKYDYWNENESCSENSRLRFLRTNFNNLESNLKSTVPLCNSLDHQNFRDTSLSARNPSVELSPILSSPNQDTCKNADKDGNEKDQSIDLLSKESESPQLVSHDSFYLYFSDDEAAQLDDSDNENSTQQNIGITFSDICCSLFNEKSFIDYCPFSVTTTRRKNKLNVSSFRSVTHCHSTYSARKRFFKDPKGSNKTVLSDTIKTDSRDTNKTDTRGTYKTGLRDTKKTDSRGTNKTGSRETNQADSRDSNKTDSIVTNNADSGVTNKVDFKGTIKADSGVTNKKSPQKTTGDNSSKNVSKLDLVIPVRNSRRGRPPAGYYKKMNCFSEISAAVKSGDRQFISQLCKPPQEEKERPLKRFLRTKSCDTVISPKKSKCNKITKRNASTSEMLTTTLRDNQSSHSLQPESLSESETQGNSSSCEDSKSIISSKKIKDSKFEVDQVNSEDKFIKNIQHLSKSSGQATKQLTLVPVFNTKTRRRSCQPYRGCSEIKDKDFVDSVAEKLNVKPVSNGLVSFLKDSIVFPENKAQTIFESKLEIRESAEVFVNWFMEDESNENGANSEPAEKSPEGNNSQLDGPGSSRSEGNGVISSDEDVNNSFDNLSTSSNHSTIHTPQDPTNIFPSVAECSASSLNERSPNHCAPNSPNQTLSNTIKIVDSELGNQSNPLSNQSPDIQCGVHPSGQPLSDSENPPNHESAAYCTISSVQHSSADSTENHLDHQSDAYCTISSSDQPPNADSTENSLAYQSVAHSTISSSDQPPTADSTENSSDDPSFAHCTISSSDQSPFVDSTVNLPDLQSADSTEDPPDLQPASHCTISSSDQPPVADSTENSPDHQSAAQPAVSSSGQPSSAGTSWRHREISPSDSSKNSDENSLPPIEAQCPNPGVEIKSLSETQSEKNVVSAENPKMTPDKLHVFNESKDSVELTSTNELDGNPSSNIEKTTLPKKRGRPKKNPEVNAAMLPSTSDKVFEDKGPSNNLPEKKGKSLPLKKGPLLDSDSMKNKLPNKNIATSQGKFTSNEETDLNEKYKSPKQHGIPFSGSPASLINVNRASEEGEIVPSSTDKKETSNEEPRKPSLSIELQNEQEGKSMSKEELVKKPCANKNSVFKNEECLNLCPRDEVSKSSIVSEKHDGKPNDIETLCDLKPDLMKNNEFVKNGETVMQKNDSENLPALGKKLEEVYLLNKNNEKPVLDSSVDNVESTSFKFNSSTPHSHGVVEGESSTPLMPVPKKRGRPRKKCHPASVENTSENDRDRLIDAGSNLPENSQIEAEKRIPTDTLLPAGDSKPKNLVETLDSLEISSVNSTLAVVDSSVNESRKVLPISKEESRNIPNSTSGSEKVETENMNTNTSLLTTRKRGRPKKSIDSSKESSDVLVESIRVSENLDSGAISLNEDSTSLPAKRVRKKKIIGDISDMLKSDKNQSKAMSLEKSNVNIKLLSKEKGGTRKNCDVINSPLPCTNDPISLPQNNENVTEKCLIQGSGLFKPEPFSEDSTPDPKKIGNLNECSDQPRDTSSHSLSGTNFTPHQNDECTAEKNLNVSVLSSQAPFLDGSQLFNEICTSTPIVKKRGRPKKCSDQPSNTSSYCLSDTNNTMGSHQNENYTTEKHLEESVLSLTEPLLEDSEASNNLCSSTPDPKKRGRPKKLSNQPSITSSHRLSDTNSIISPPENHKSIEEERKDKSVHSSQDPFLQDPKSMNITCASASIPKKRGRPKKHSDISNITSSHCMSDINNTISMDQNKEYTSEKRLDGLGPEQHLSEESQVHHKLSSSPSVPKERGGLRNGPDPSSSTSSHCLPEVNNTTTMDQNKEHNSEKCLDESGLPLPEHLSGEALPVNKLCESTSIPKKRGRPKKCSDLSSITSSHSLSDVNNTTSMDQNKEHNSEKHLDESGLPLPEHRSEEALPFNKLCESTSIPNKRGRPKKSSDLSTITSSHSLSDVNNTTSMDQNKEHNSEKNLDESGLPVPEHLSEEALPFNKLCESTSIPKKRGRPKKCSDLSSITSSHSLSDVNNTTSIDQNKENNSEKHLDEAGLPVPEHLSEESLPSNKLCASTSIPKKRGRPKKCSDLFSNTSSNCLSKTNNSTSHDCDSSTKDIQGKSVLFSQDPFLEDSNSLNIMSASTPVPKKRGRPRKNPEQASNNSSLCLSDTNNSITPHTSHKSITEKCLGESEVSSQEETFLDISKASINNMCEPTPIPKKRGRPRKLSNTANSLPQGTPVALNMSGEASDFPKQYKKRGRKPKNRSFTTESNIDEAQSSLSDSVSGDKLSLVRKPGRPRKRPRIIGDQEKEGTFSDGSCLSLDMSNRLSDDDSPLPLTDRQIRRRELSGRIDGRSRLRNPNQMVTCAVCKESMPARTYQKFHILKHNFMTWLEGEKPLPLDNIEAMINLLTRGKKHHPKHLFKCPTCNEVKRSAVGFLSHQQFCGKSESEKEQMLVSCEYCGRIMMPMSLQPHIYQSHSEPKEVSGFGGDELTEVQSVRKAAAKCIDKIADYIEEEGLQPKRNKSFDNDYVEEKEEEEEEINEDRELSLLYIKVRRRATKNMKCRWKQCENRGDPLCCTGVGCGFTCSSFDEMLKHHKYCDFGTSGFSCIKCNMTSANEEEMRDHVKICNPPIALSTSDSSDSEDHDKINGLPYLRKEESKDNHIRLKSNFFKTALPWMKKICSTNFSNIPLFPEFNVSAELWQGLHDDEFPRYKYENPKSLRVSIENSDWKPMDLYEGNVFNGREGVGYCGGPIWGLAWCPGEGEQFLATAPQHSMESNFQVGSTATGPSLVQIWSIGDANNLSSSELTFLKFSFGICHEEKGVWDLAWCPSGGRSEDRLGLLALATVSGSIPIFAVPHPKTLPENGNRLYKSDPVIKLELYSNEKWQCSAVSWSKIKPHRIVAAGFVNGLIAVWDLTAKAKLLCSSGKIRYPFKIFQAHSSFITGISLSPESEEYLASSSFDKTFKFWDLKDTTSPQSVTRRGLFTGADWLRHWMMCVTSYDIAYTMSQTTVSLSTVRDFIQPSMQVITSTNSTAWSVATNDWLNAIAASYENGQAMVIFALKHVLTNQKDKKKYSMVVVRSDTQELPSADVGEAVPSTSSSNSESTAHSHENVSLTGYENASKKYGLKISMDPVVKHYGKPDLLEENTGEGKLDVYPLNSINKIAWNPNEKSFCYLAMGYQSGFLVVLKLSFPSKDQTLIDSFHSEEFKE